MKRTMSRKLRYHAEMNPVAEYDSAYIGKHESIIDSIAEIMAELCEALDITPEFIAEITAPARELARKVTERVQKFVERKFPMPEIRIRWKFSGFWDAGIYDLPVIYDGRGYAFHAGTV